MRIRNIRDHSYFQDVFFIYDFDTKEINQWFKREKIDQTWTESQSGRYQKMENGKYAKHFIMVKGKSLTSWVEASLGHELLHLTFAVLKDAGVVYCDESEEAFTYYFQSMFAQCLKLLYKVP